VYKENIEVICIGQAVLDCITKGWNGGSPDSIAGMADSIDLAPGGDAYNEGVILSRLGHRVQVMCRLGHDIAGGIITGKLMENAVDTNAVFYSDTAPTPVAVLLVAGNGSRRSMNSAAQQSHTFEPDISLLKGVKVVSLASLFRIPFVHPETILTVCRAAKANGAIVTADTKLVYNNQLTLADIKAALPYIDYIFPNETEAEYYTQKKEYSAMADVFLDFGVKNVIIKTGPKGCFVKNMQTCFTVPAYRLNACDTTGAGDNFAAGFISSVIRGFDLREAVEFATACAALCVQSVGGTAAIQNREQIEAFILNGSPGNL